jgi:hypothetical protein
MHANRTFLSFYEGSDESWVLFLLLVKAAESHWIVRLRRRYTLPFLPISLIWHL